MAKRKLIVVACGNGIASSGAAVYKLKKCLADRKLDAEVVAVGFGELRNLSSKADLLVHLAPYDKYDYGIPFVNGIPFLTGAGLGPVMDQIEKVIKG